MVLGQCDFPADPPLKQRASSTAESRIDSARALLPLKVGNVWTYIAVPKDEGSQSGYAIASQQTFSGSIYYDVKYVFFPAKTWMAVLAFPSIMQSSDRALSFFEKGNGADSNGTRLPHLLFTLPYPAAAASVWSNGVSDYSVTVAAKDTMLASYDGANHYSCYRYDVQRMHGPGQGHRTSIYCIPGSAILKIESEDIIFYTTEWSVE